MDKYFFNLINRYFTTLLSIGKVKREEKYSLFMAIGIYNLYKFFITLTDPATNEPIVKEEDAIKFNKYLHCLANSNPCLFEKFMPELMCAEYSDSIESLVTIIDSDMLITQTGAIQVSQSGRTQNFTDFEMRTSFQSDNYVVGYDESDRKEVKFNVNDFGTFWEEDI